MVNQLQFSLATETNKTFIAPGTSMFISAVKFSTRALTGFDSLLEPAPSGHARSCSFWALPRQLGSLEVTTWQHPAHTQEMPSFTTVFYCWPVCSQSRTFLQTSYLGCIYTSRKIFFPSCRFISALFRTDSITLLLDESQWYLRGEDGVIYKM